MSKISKTFRIAAAMLVALFSGNFLPATTAYAANNGGNNGTIKVHEKGTPSGTESNDPKVCVFNFEAFGLDANQTGDITITGQGQTPDPNPPVVISLSTNAAGDGSTAYVNDTDNAITLANGHYKATLDNKFGTDKGNKAKSKVFKVNCQTQPTEVTPNVSIIDECGTADDSVTGVETEGISYEVTKSGMQYTVTATPDNGYELVEANGFTLKRNGTAVYTVILTDETCETPDTPATPEKVMNIDVCGKRNDTYTIPNTEGVNYYVNGSLTPAGTYTAPKNNPRSVTITAQAQDGYQLTEEYSETINFTNTKCAKVTICHRTNSVTNPYVKITVSVNAVDSIAGNNNGKDHYGEHQGPLATSEEVAQALKDQKIKWGDIIPPVSPHHEGLNWTDEGQAMLENNCNYIPVEPTPVTPEVPTAVNLCYDDNDYITIPETEGVIYKANGQVVSGSTWFDGSDIEITAEAAEGYTLENYTGPWTFTSADFAGQDCLEIKKAFKSYEDTDHNGTFSIGDTLTWTVTVTNNSNVDLNEAFNVEVTDLGVTIALENLGAGQSLEREVTTKLTSDDMRACKATNTATFSGWRAYQEVSPSLQAEVLTKAVNMPLATGSATAEYSFTCGRGGYTPPAPTDTKTPSAPNTGVASHLVQADPKSNVMPVLALIIVTLAYGALYFARPRQKFER
ncbi:MAG TPA: hypothetical protein VGE34_02775 [Candidatus Saccharimonadales bacterium]